MTASPWESNVDKYFYGVSVQIPFNHVRVKHYNRTVLHFLNSKVGIIKIIILVYGIAVFMKMRIRSIDFSMVTSSKDNQNVSISNSDSDE